MQEIKKIVFKKQALEIISSEIANYGLIETGGVLMGNIIDGIIYIEKISNSGPNAIHEDIYFRADSNYIDMFIDMEYANSDGKYKYIGEWHTHPQMTPVPSPKDLDSLTEIAESSDEFCLLLIVGAIDYQNSKFLDQSIAILKRKEEEQFEEIFTNIT